MPIKDNYNTISGKIRDAGEQSLNKGANIELLAVSKTQSIEKIEELLAQGHRSFGENKVQEAKSKWESLKQQHSNVQLHLIGPLQSNKAAEAVMLFDVIQTIDREKIAATLADEMKKQNKSLPCYIQVNIGEEEQKHGVLPQELSEFTKRCIHEHGLNIEGYMCIPPAGEPPAPYFALLQLLAKANGIEKLSMGMSKDYETAIRFGANCVRVGTALFGARAA